MSQPTPERITARAPWIPAQQHPGDVLRIFVSAANADLKSFRVRARDVLWTCEVFVDMEENLGVDYRKIRQVLHERIGKADALISLIGFAYGGEPPGEVTERRSYTQWEFKIACELKLPVFRFLATDPTRLDHAAPEQETLVQLQQQFRQRIESDEEQRWYFQDVEELEILLKRVNFKAIWKARQQRRVGGALFHPPDAPMLSNAVPSEDEWKRAVGLVVCGDAPNQRPLGTAFCVAQGEFLATTPRVAMEADTALKEGPVRVLWEQHYLERMESRLDKSWPEGLLRLAGAERTNLALIATSNNVSIGNRPNITFTALCATRPLDAAGRRRVQIERVPLTITGTGDDRLCLGRLKAHLPEAQVRGAPVLDPSGEVVAILDHGDSGGFSESNNLVLHPIAEFRRAFPKVI